jgi:hypothetical protein
MDPTCLFILLASLGLLVILVMAIITAHVLSTSKFNTPIHWLAIIFLYTGGCTVMGVLHYFADILNG